MILLDFSQIMISNLSIALKGQTDVQLDIDRLRSMVLYSIKHYRQKFKADYGDDFVVCCDSRVKSWRHEVFPYYKIRRARTKDKSSLDWPAIQRLFDQIIMEVKENFPYATVRVDRAEADDIIGVLARKSLETGERTIIVSCDRDFYQLLVDNPHVSMYNHIIKREVNRASIPDDFLKDKIIRGDSGDDIPNILTQDDTFAIGKRSKTLYEKKVAELLSTSMNAWTTDERTRYSRNETLIDLSRTPDDVRDEILASYNDRSVKGRSRIYPYLVKHRLKELLNDIKDF